MKKTMWISYDLGVDGDYESFYQWLDSHGAKECGDSCALIQGYEFEGDFITALERDLEISIQFTKRNRVYVIFKDVQGGKLKGSFVLGKRKKAPWAGYAVEEDETVDEVGS